MRRESKLASEQLAAIKEAQQRARQEYEALLKSLDPQIRDAIRQHLSRIEFLIGDGTFDEQDRQELIRIGQQFVSDLRSVTRDSSVLAIDFAKKGKAAELGVYIADLQRLLSAQGVAASEIAASLELPRLVPNFGGGLDKQILDGVWNKVWPDSLNVDDRIKRIAVHSLKETERMIKEGISLGKSAFDISRDLRGHFEGAGLERKAAFRLAAHTTNMAYQSAQAEISIQAKFVMGVRIVRGMYGNMSENCAICEEHAGPPGGSGKVYYKSDFGGRDMDLWIMTNGPSYHSFCSCGVETIFEDAVTFVKKAREGFAN